MILAALILDAPASWQPATISVYSWSYQGKTTNSGSRFDMHKLTAAAPVKGKTKRGRHIPSIPFGTMVEVRYGKRTVTVKITDTCIGGTLDLSGAAFKALHPGYDMTDRTGTLLKGQWRVKK